MSNKVVCIGVYFQNQSAPSSLVKTSDINIIKNYINEASYGQFQFDVHVIPLVKLPINRTTNLAEVQWAITNTPEYQAYLSNNGWPNYNWFVIFGGPKGLASGRTVYVRDSTPKFLLHEIGHSLGMWHASAGHAASRTDPQAESWKYFEDRWNLSEYGDTTCTMGGTNNLPNHYNSRHKEIPGWLTPTVVTSSGMYSLNTIATHPEALKIDGGEGRFFYVDFRSRKGFDNSTRTPNNGLQIRFVRGSSFRTILLRSRWDTRNHLVVGESYRDLYSDFLIEFDSIVNDVAKVKVTFGGSSPPPDPPPPDPELGDLQTKVGTFVTPNSTGNFNISGVGFKPKAVLFFSNLSGSTGIGSHARSGIGVGVSSSERWCVYGNSADKVSSSSCSRVLTTNKAYRETSVFGTNSVFEFDFVSQNTNGFTINITNSNSFRPRVGYIALGGDAISDVKAGSFTLTSGSGNQSVTGVGFRPDLVLFGASLAVTGTNSNQIHGAVAFGIAKSPTERWASSWFSSSSENTANASRDQVTNRCLIRTGSDQRSVMSVDFVSQDTNGFTVKKVTPPNSNLTVTYLALKGNFNSRLGSFNQPSSSGNQSVTNVGFRPKLNFFVSNNALASESTIAHSKQMFGAATSSGERFVYATRDQNGVNTTNSTKYLSTNSCIASVNNSFSAVEAEADFVSNNTNGFTVNWSKADSANREVLFLSLA